MRPELSKRLSVIADLVPDCDTFVDVGCDHGYVPVSLLIDDRCKKAVFADINQGPLDKARQNALHYGIDNERASFIRSDGLDQIPVANGTNVLSVTGMGGLLIADILSRGRNKLSFFDTFILSPHTKEAELRVFLWNEGYVTIDERYVLEDDKLYVIIAAKKADPAAFAHKLSDTELKFGKYIQRELKDADVRRYFEMKLSAVEDLLSNNRDIPFDRKQIIEKEAICYREVLGIEA